MSLGRVYGPWTYLRSAATRLDRTDQKTHVTLARLRDRTGGWEPVFSGQPVDQAKTLDPKSRDGPAKEVGPVVDAASDS